MKKALLLITTLMLSLVANPCTCVDDFFCSANGIGPNAVIVYGHKVSDIDTTGVVFKVIESWGPNATANTITIWNDSLVAYAPVMGPGPVFQCSNDIRRQLTGIDTFIISIRPYDTTLAFGTTGDYVFYHDLCQTDILWVKDGMVRDTNSWYDRPVNPGVMAIIEEPVAAYKSRLENAEGCNYTRIISGIDDTNNPNSLRLNASNKQLTVMGNLNAKPIHINLYNINGQLVYSSESTAQTHDLSNLSTALYIAEVKYEGGVHRQKVLLQ